MSSFGCPHFDMTEDSCLKLKTRCVPGRPGCVLRGHAVFAVPAELRLREKRTGNPRNSFLKGGTQYER